MTIDIFCQKYEKVLKTTQNVPKTVGNHQEQLVFCLRITTLVILASKKAKKQILWSGNWYHWQQKCFKNPFFHHFEPPKGYVICHIDMYIGKVTMFGLFRIIIFRSNCHFSVGGRNTPPPTGVGLILPGLLSIQARSKCVAWNF